MGVQHLGPRWIRRLERITKQNICFAVAGGGFVFEFVTIDHVHFLFDRKVWSRDPNHDDDLLYEMDIEPVCYTSCDRFFGEDKRAHVDRCEELVRLNHRRIRCLRPVIQSGECYWQGRHAK